MNNPWLWSESMNEEEGRMKNGSLDSKKPGHLKCPNNREKSRVAVGTSGLVVLVRRLGIPLPPPRAPLFLGARNRAHLLGVIEKRGGGGGLKGHDLKCWLWKVGESIR